MRQSRFLLMRRAGGEDIDKALEDLLVYIDSGKATGPLSKKIDSDVILARQNKEWRSRYMTLEWEIAYAAREAAREAREKALEEGVEQGLVNSILTLLQKFTPEQIVEFGFHEETVKKAIAQSNQGNN